MSAFNIQYTVIQALLDKIEDQLQTIHSETSKAIIAAMFDILIKIMNVIDSERAETIKTITATNDTSANETYIVVIYNDKKEQEFEFENFRQHIMINYANKEMA